VTAWRLLLAVALGAAPVARAAAQAPAPTRPSASREWAAVEDLARAGRWADALAAVEPLATDSLGRAVAARVAVNAGLAAYRRGDVALARERWRLAVRLDPALTIASSDLATLYLVSGAPDSARAIALRGLAFAPGDPRLLAIRTQSLGNAAAIDSAIARDRAVRRRQPRDEAVALDLAALLAAAGRTLPAAALYDTLLAARAPSLAVYAGASRFWLGGGHADAAVALADTGLNRYPRAADLWMVAGAGEVARKRWRAAATAYGHAADLLPEPEEAELSLIDADAAAGDTAAAADVVRAMAAGSAPVGALVEAARRAAALGAAGRGPADSALRGALRHAPDDVGALEAAADLAISSGDTARAVALYRRDMALDSGGPEAPFALLHLARPAPDSGRTLLLLAEWRGMAALQRVEAGTFAAAGAARGREAAAALSPLERRHVELARVVRAVLDTVVFATPWGPAELSQLQRVYPGSVVLERYAAELAARRGDDSAALERYATLLKDAPDDADAQRKYAAVLERAGRPEDAAHGYARALDLEPGDTTAFRALIRLDERSSELDGLLAQVRRLRTLMPRSRTLGEHEVEVLQRLGRLAEAADVARGLKETPS